MQPAKRAVLVLGMHRSGTSLCSRIVNLMGFEAPRTLMPPTEANAEGYWESALISQLNDQLLSECGVLWHARGPLAADPFTVARRTGLYGALRDAIASEFDGAERIVLKDPRICRLVPLYEDLLTDAGYRIAPVIALRNPSEVAASLAKRDQMKTERAIRIWLRYTLEAERATRGRARAVVAYEDVVRDWRTLAVRLAEVMDLPAGEFVARAEAEAAKAVRPDLRHHALGLPAPISLFRLLSRRVYQAMRKLVDEPNDTAAARQLDRQMVLFEMF